MNDKSPEEPQGFGYKEDLKIIFYIVEKSLY
jgi:hypothetical protein